MKPCTRCGHVYDATAAYFYRNHRQGDGLSPRCKVCDGAKSFKGRMKTGETRAWREDGIAEFGLAGELRAIEEARRAMESLPRIEPAPRLARIPGMVRLPCGTLVREGSR